jgi:hypothetical protein
MKTLHCQGKERSEEKVMRSMIVAVGLAALTAGVLAQPAAAKKSKMGCEIGREHWDATEAKCVPGKSVKKTAKKAKKDE